MRRKQKKTKEEKLAENFFPVDEDDLKRAIEKEEKRKDNTVSEIIEKKGRKKTKTKVKKAPKKLKVKKAKQKTEFSTPKVKLKDSGWELIITEKPQAALKIASALGKPEKYVNQKVPYYEIEKNGRRIIVACAVGHLFTLKQKAAKPSGEPVFDISWVPNYMARKQGSADFTKRYHDTISKLVKQASEVTVATDYDIEGEVIGLNVVRFICGQKDANRMKFSTLTEKELNKSYEDKSKTLNWGQAIAGETRHFLDWIYGINLSRSLMNAIKSTGKFRIMSIGRVQGPALKLIVDKEKQIKKFKSEKYWQVFIKVKSPDSKVEIELKHNKDISKKAELKKFDNLVGEKINVQTLKTEQVIPPNPPFNLTALQTESYNLFGYNPSKTLQIAQSLYLGGLISYPRTSSQKLPDALGYDEILKKISEKHNAEKLVTRKRPVEGKKSDPAHPSIYPTGQNLQSVQALSEEEKKVYSLIEKRFLALFCEDAIVDNKRIVGQLGELRFTTSGLAIRNKNWMAIYPVKLKEKEIPDLEGECDITSSRNEEKETQPPKRYSQASIISILEKKNLGTKATRSSILETLYNRGYVKEKSIEATPLGISLIDTLEKYSPIITDEELTRNFEKEMELIVSSKDKFEEKEEKVLDKARKTITQISTQFKENEKEIGDELLKANINLTEQLKKENTLNVCPSCNKGNLAVTYSKKTQRYFVACNAYPDCKTTYSLPPNGLIKKSGKACEKCGWPMLIRISKGKRPWVFCFNPECEINKERVEEYRKKKEAENINKN